MRVLVIVAVVGGREGELVDAVTVIVVGKSEVVLDGVNIGEGDETAASLFGVSVFTIRAVKPPVSRHTTTIHATIPQIEPQQAVAKTLDAFDFGGGRYGMSFSKPRRQ